jgi:hypothetical protein
MKFLKKLFKIFDKPKPIGEDETCIIAINVGIDDGEPFDFTTMDEIIERQTRKYKRAANLYIQGTKKPAKTHCTIKGGGGGCFHVSAYGGGGAGTSGGAGAAHGLWRD